MSYASWELRNFHRPLHARVWSAICAKARAVRSSWRSFYRAWMAWYGITV